MQEVSRTRRKAVVHLQHCSCRCSTASVAKHDQFVQGFARPVYTLTQRSCLCLAGAKETVRVSRTTATHSAEAYKVIIGSAGAVLAHTTVQVCASVC